MTVVVVRDVPRGAFVLLANGERVGEFRDEATAWRYAELSFGVVQTGSRRPLTKEGE